MDQTIRNKLRGVVTQCRRLLKDSVSQELQGKFGVYAAGKDDVQVDDEARMSHLGNEERAARKDILGHLDHIKARGFKPKEALDQLVREVAFTHLNRLCAYRMMEARQVYVGDQRFREAVSRGVNSNGVKFYLAEHPDDERLFTSGQQDVAYRHFLDWLGGLLSEEIGVLFSPHDPANRLYPPQRVLDDVLGLINDEALADIWGQDETIGWVYQYFTPKELRDQARKESQAPRNSYELAFRNQFFTPRYVVEFLTDNTLGRIWYEMRKGDTKLKEQCRYLVRRPNEIFLAEGQSPAERTQSQDGLSQEELLKQPFHIPFRPKKDPRELNILDPACGSGHFLLYCFDLLLTIYEEAYADPDLGPNLKEDYPTLEALRRDAPRLILAQNLHGIDIDLRATQIAALALWLRCQRAYREMGLKQDRPKITKSNIVCAEPMPGEKALLGEFLKTLKRDRLEALIRRAIQVPEGTRVRATEAVVESLAELVRLVWEKMRLAGEAGSLLKIEKALQEAVRKGQKEWEETQPLFRFTEFSLTEKKETHVRSEPGEGVSFWQRAEALVLEALRDYVCHTGNGGRLQRQLFAEDAAQGFAFIDLCQKRFDVVLMNPPFGEPSKPARDWFESEYSRTKHDLYGAFVERGLGNLRAKGILGAITSRTGFFLSSFQKWREELLLGSACPLVVADLGQGVLDTAMVETAAYCLGTNSNLEAVPFIRLLATDNKDDALLTTIHSVQDGLPDGCMYLVCPRSFRLIARSPLAYWVDDRVRRLFASLPALSQSGREAVVTNSVSDDNRYFRCSWEVSPDQIGKTIRWVPLSKGGAYSRYYSDIHLLIDWDHKAQSYRGFEGTSHRPLKRPASMEYFFRPGLTYSRRSQKGFSVRILPSGSIFQNKGPAIFSQPSDLPALLGLMNSRIFQALLELQMAFGSYEVGVVQRTPMPDLSQPTSARLGELALESVDFKRRLDTAVETSHVFCIPALLQVEGNTLIERCDYWHKVLVSIDLKLQEHQAEIDMIALRLYGFGTDNRVSVESHGGDVSQHSIVPDDATDEAEGEAGPSSSSIAGVSELISYAVGVPLGRWDIRCFAHLHRMQSLPSHFDVLPPCSPGTLQRATCVSALSVPADYPINIKADGILLDDPDHPDDIVRRVRDVLELIWKDRPDAIEKEACEILGVKELRDYFRKPGKGGFWDDHVARYSKSRRKAPIYWLLQSSKKNYALWLYYHRLDKDLLFKALVNYVEPKIQLEGSRLETLRTQRTAASGSGRDAKRLGKEVERQEDFLSELRDFEDKLRRAANLHLEPDLNDGVVLNIAPLWELVPWKEAKNHWEELLGGEYEWSSIGKQLRQKELVK